MTLAVFHGVGKWLARRAELSKERNWFADKETARKKRSIVTLSMPTAFDFLTISLPFAIPR